jgi:hypothetical protein
MPTTKHIKSIQEHLQAVFEQSVRAELKYMMEEDTIPGLFDEVNIDDLLVKIKVSVSTVANSRQ